jgi:hypothetical protein
MIVPSMMMNTATRTLFPATCTKTSQGASRVYMSNNVGVLLGCGSINDHSVNCECPTASGDTVADTHSPSRV